MYMYIHIYIYRYIYKNIYITAAHRWVRRVCRICPPPRAEFLIAFRHQRAGAGLAAARDRIGEGGRRINRVELEAVNKGGVNELL